MSEDNDDDTPNNETPDDGAEAADDGAGAATPESNGEEGAQAQSGNVKLDELEEGEEREDSDEEGIQRTAQDLEAVFDVPVSISAVLGRTHMEVSELLHLDSGDVIELDRKVGEAIDIYVNNRLIARGEVVLLDDKLGITMTEIIKTERH